MKIHLLLAVLLLTSSGSIVRSAELTAASNPYEGFQSYMGRFSAAIPLGDGQLIKRLETRTSWAENSKGVRFETWEVKEGKLEPHNSGTYKWNATKKQFEFHETRSDGSVISGFATFEGKVLLQEFTVTQRDGAIMEGRVVSTTISNDVFTEESSWLKNGHWRLASLIRWERMDEPNHSPEPAPGAAH
jgi:hypothetical protein